MNCANVYLFLPDVKALISFTQKVFDTTLIKEITRANGSVAHAEIKIGDSILMAAEPADAQYFPASIYVYVQDCEHAFQRALAAGAQVAALPAHKPAENEKYGAVKDTNGNLWWIVEHLHDN